MHDTGLETDWSLSDWVLWISRRMGAKLTEHQVQMYVEEIGSWGLTQGELMALERIVRRSCDKWPGPATLRTMANAVRFAKADTEPIFELRKDAEGRTWARPTNLRRSSTPDAHTIERWKQEMATPEEAREAWNHAFYLKGLDPVPTNGKTHHPEVEDDKPKPLEPIGMPEMYRVILGLGSEAEYLKHREENPSTPGISDYDDSPEALGESEDEW